MSQSLDFLIVGTSPLAAFLALDLAQTHGAKTALLGQIRSPFLIQTGISIATGAITRPETWALLSASAQDHARIFSALGLNGLHKNDVVVASLDADAQYALQHSRQTALMYGVPAEKLPETGTDWRGNVMRQTAVLSPSSYLDDLPDALAAANIALYDSEAWELKLGTGGTGRLLHQDDEIHAQKILLVDDAAIEQFIPRSDRDAHFTQNTVSALLMSEHAELRWSNLLDPASGGQAAMTSFGSAWARHVGTQSELIKWVETALAPNSGGEVVAQASWAELVSNDGAAVVGQLRRSGPFIIHVPQPYGLFLGPALARFLADDAGSEEKAYFEVRALRSAKLRSEIVEYRPVAKPKRAKSGGAKP